MMDRTSYDLPVEIWQIIVSRVAELYPLDIVTLRYVNKALARALAAFNSYVREGLHCSIYYDFICAVKTPVRVNDIVDQFIECRSWRNLGMLEESVLTYRYYHDTLPINIYIIGARNSVQCDLMIYNRDINIHLINRQFTMAPHSFAAKFVLQTIRNHVPEVWDAMFKHII
jgi:hypothetical protein